MDLDLARRVRTLMDLKGLKQKDIAQMAGIPAPTVSGILKGDDVRLSTVRKLIGAIEPLEESATKRSRKRSELS